MSFSSPPQAPDPGQVAQNQYQYNVAAGQKQQQLNEINQAGPYGSLTYVPDPSAPGGMRLVTGLQGAAGTNYGTYGNLANNVAGMYGSAPNLDPSTMTNTTMAMENQYLAPWFNQQNSNMTAQLANEGFAPGSEGYTNAMRGLTEGQQGTMANTFLQAEPQAFNQAVQSYQLPMQTMQQLYGLTQPNFQQTPQTQVQPPNYAGLAEQNYQDQLKQYQANQAGMWGIGSALAGGLGQSAGSWGPAAMDFASTALLM